VSSHSNDLSRAVYDQVNLGFRQNAPTFLRSYLGNRRY
jgi:hypothetical protein